MEKNKSSFTDKKTEALTSQGFSTDNQDLKGGLLTPSQQLFRLYQTVHLNNTKTESTIVSIRLIKQKKDPLHLLKMSTRVVRYR